MRKIIIYVLFIFMVGCSYQSLDVEFQDGIVTVEERTEDDYKVTKIIEDSDKVKIIIDIFEGQKWTVNTDVDMAHEEDFRLNDYKLWITPQGDSIEIIAPSGDFTRVIQDEAVELFELITGKD